MAQATSIFGWRSPTLLLLGLLALLLWGQCAALLFPGTTHVPITVKGQVKSLDSLGTAPAALYLTLLVRNDLSQPVLVREVSGTLRYNGRAHPFSATAALRDTLLYPWTELTQPVAVALHLPPDSLAQLRTVLQTGYPATQIPDIQWQAIYSLREAPGARHKARITPYFSPLPGK
jgi:hypothetical protein